MDYFCMIERAALSCSAAVLISAVSPSDDFYFLAECEKNLKKIVSVDAEIVQHITENGRNPETYHGRFRALDSGLFRIDYTVPEKQQLFYNGKVLFWYYPEKKIVYRSSAVHDAPAAACVMRQIPERGKKALNAVYSGLRRVGLFETAAVYTIDDMESKLKIFLWIDPEKKVLLRKTVKSPDEYEIAREIFSGYRNISGIYFPGKLEVAARTGNGTTESVAEYSAVILNGSLPETLFTPDIPKDVIIRDFIRR